VRSSGAQCFRGCDGARSCVQEALHLGFPGGTYEQLFYVADVKIARGFSRDLYINLAVAPRYDYFRIDADGTRMWLGATDSLAEAHKLINQQTSESPCQYCNMDQREGTKHFVADIEELRGRLPAMPNRQLSDFRRAAEHKCSSGLNVGHPPDAVFVLELKEANEECPRRYFNGKEG
jgi:2-polyprenyl-6-methoxyphenol hydroxylase-like FAD-dependent oxidoreductase